MSSYGHSRQLRCSEARPTCRAPSCPGPALAPEVCKVILSRRSVLLLAYTFPAMPVACAAGTAPLGSQRPAQRNARWHCVTTPLYHWRSPARPAGPASASDRTGQRERRNEQLLPTFRMPGSARRQPRRSRLALLPLSGRTTGPAYQALLWGPGYGARLWGPAIGARLLWRGYSGASIPYCRRHPVGSISSSTSSTVIWPSIRSSSSTTGATARL